MILYHASNVEVKKPMLAASNRMLDFGPGFYTTTNREQAIRFAKSVVAKRGGRMLFWEEFLGEDGWRRYVKSITEL